MSKIQVDTIVNSSDTGAPNLPNGVTVSGVATATTFVGNITGVAATFTGNVSIAGTLTYEDVTNIDSIGLITARSGIQVLAGGIDAVGIVTATSFDGSLNTSGIVTANGYEGNFILDSYLFN